ncbi:MAG: Repeat domain in Vibrio, Colwellia, Bradyrhizobium and Shewanella, partial [Bacteroidetes bacterium]|nr:Repeat domain in Vibrio, Colwellia, Bradyrhizobium and Shewanella [Bacteroidota bacterium]
GPDGSVKYSWPFDGVPAPAPTRIGLYEWVVTGGVHETRITASYYASYSMNSEQTITIDLKGRELWRRGQYGEGEWGRGMGPWSAYAVSGSREGNHEILFLAKDLFCRLDARTGEWTREPWLLWRATNSVMNQPDWEFTKERQADFGSEKDPFTAYGSPIVLEEGSAVLVAGCFGGFGLLRKDDGIAWWKRAPFTDTMLRLPGIAANGIFECIDAGTGATLWELDLGSTTSDVASGDIDGDGKEEFITGTTDGRLIAIGVDGSGRGILRWSLDLGFALGSPVIADVDGDGEAEILIVSGEGNLVCVGKE